MNLDTIEKIRQVIDKSEDNMEAAENAMKLLEEIVELKKRQ